MLRRTLLTSGLAVVAAAGAARAQTPFPSRPITIIVPFPAGSATDGVARQLAEYIRAALGNPVVVENKPGADGIVAAQQVLRSEPDGHTFFVTTNTTHSANPAIYRTLPYDAQKDFAPIGGIMTIPAILTVNQKFPAKTLAELVEVAKSRSLTFASGNTISRGPAELLKARTGADLRHVPYRGTPQALTDLVGGQVDLMFADPSSALSLIKDGALRVLAVTSSARIASLPDVPTMTEAGVPGVELVAWVAAFAHAKTPPEIQKTLSDLVLKYVREAKTAEYFQSIGSTPFPAGPEELARYVAEDTKRWAEVVDLGKIERK